MIVILKWFTSQHLLTMICRGPWGWGWRSSWGWSRRLRTTWDHIKNRFLLKTLKSPHRSIFANIQCVFFSSSQKFVNLTYLYSEIKKQGLIFSVGMGHLIICKKNVDLDRGFLSKPVFLLYACRASVELWIGKRFQSSWTWPYFWVYYTNKALVYYTSLVSVVD